MRKRLLGDSVSTALRKLQKIDLDRYQPVEVSEWSKQIKGRRLAEIREMKSAMKLSGEYRSRTSWSRFQFPLHYDSDLLEVLLCFARLGMKKNDVLERGAGRVLELRGKDGFWRARRSLNGKMWADLKTQNDWITLRALEIVAQYGRPTPL